MEIHFFDLIDSTQRALIKDLKENRITPPVAYYTDFQTSGIGSRGNSWIGKKGNFFLSFALHKRSLPDDLPIQSIAIYFMYQLKELLTSKGSKVWLKWPNDLYIGTKKCGGCVTNIVQDVIVCGIGVNIVSAPEGFGVLDIKLDERRLLQEFFTLLEQKRSWKQIFSKYKLEFHKSRSFFAHIKGEKISLASAKLAEDGALIIQNERVYSNR